ncbi:pseudouridine synthase [Flavobacterium johnsoniae]|jgi:23S rRNA pseudouridine2605 synthase|uniref:Ribosomal large subunit pseudouridine synthase B n=2 Tax=Flavobacterium johnsoniae TaxID=986 RepID=A0A1M5GUI8_FLAJO|nr:pseudouridine synthase [Flavobacterium johnsoniae]ABQ04416.1 ribosomal large subunit pseudouridine synthase B [Flavobacterium johnsoniae UW101]OXE97740.1 pseudouridylate synthase [Flavobacterium johnsoniae UW101]WQG83790.1 pseudouridine synthase [Flavobacterium johnsoniae UW101]SHG07082.1 ribosomal large subunit pseudouridine synthase B [Flavobacterium johnsoniae]SHK21887.1 ribosomal large subunit pseudouridine synthase B [Flavobacterium johnsoniae]
MNNKEGNNKRGGSRPNSSRSNSSKPKPPMAKRAQGPKKVKPEVKAAQEAAAEKLRKQNQPAKRQKASDEIRLNKYISNSGVCSRRDADLYIQSGNVKVNGVPVTEMGYLVKLNDVVNFDGVTLTPEKKEYILLNKPKNFTTALDEGQEYRNVLELVRAATNAKIAPIGRMDKNTTGLLLFTNDTDMIRKFSLPNQKSPKIYQVSLDKNLKFEDLEKISKGLVLDGHRVSVEEISYIEKEPKSEVGLKLRSSNVKVVRAIFENFDYNVLRIDRVSFAGLTKKNLPRGNWRFLTDQEVINLKNA